MRLLIVEDEVRLASALQRGLAAEGFTVDLAHTGPDGLHMAQESTYDAVILDIMLPELSGYRIIEQLRGSRELGADPDAHGQGRRVRRGRRPRPRRRRLPDQAVLLRRAAGAHPGPAAPRRARRGRRSLRVDDLVLDPAAHTVKRGDTTVDLTPREFSLLEFLMRRAGDAVSKADILHHVWDANYDGDANVVEVYVGYLRRKIDVPFERQSLQTVRGAGYRLTPEA